MLAPTPEHLRPILADITNIIHELAPKILDATVDDVRTRMDIAQKQGEKHSPIPDKIMKMGEH